MWWWSWERRSWGEARIRVQLSAEHTKEHVEHAAAAFEAVGRELGVIS